MTPNDTGPEFSTSPDDRRLARHDDAADTAIASMRVLRHDLLKTVSRASVVFIAVAGGIAALKLAGEFVLPTVLAIVIAFMLTPVAHVLERRGVERRIAGALAVAVLVGGALFGAALVAPTVQSWADKLPETTRLLERELRNLRTIVAAVETATEEMEKSVTLKGESASPDKQVVVADDSVVTKAAFLAPAILAQIGYMIFLVYFLLTERQAVRGALLSLSASFKSRRRLARLFKDMRNTVSTYLFTIACINVVLGLLTGCALYLLDIPNAAVWGAGMALLNFVPYLGPILMQAVIFLVGLQTFGSLEQAWIAPAVLLAINIVEGNLITPTLVGRRVVFNPLAVFAAIAFCVWLWGVGGAIVAVPLMIIVWTALRALMGDVSGVRTAKVLLAD